MSANEPVLSYKSSRANPVERSLKRVSYDPGEKIPSTTGLAATSKADYPLYWSKPDAVERPPISPLSLEQTRAQVEQIIRADAMATDQPTRWCLRRLLSVCGPLLALKTLRGLLGVLRRLGISRQRARAYVHSPDPQYAKKLAHIQSVITQADNHQQVVVFADQLTYYNQPHRRSDQPGPRLCPPKRPAQRTMGLRRHQNLPDYGLSEPLRWAGNGLTTK